MYFMDFDKQFTVHDPDALYIVEDEKLPVGEIYANVNNHPIPMFRGDIDDVNKMFKAMWQAIKNDKNYFEFSNLYHLREV